VSSNPDLTLTEAGAKTDTALPKRGRRGAEHGDLIIKRAAKRGHDDDHGGTWKVAFADFCLALMCLFLLLWVLGARNEEETSLKLIEMADSVAYEGSSGVLDGTPAAPPSVTPREELAPRGQDAYSADTAAPATMPAETEAALRALAERVRQVGEDIGLRDNLQAIITPLGLRVMLHDTDEQGVFVSGGATPSALFRPMLTKLGALMGAVGNPLLVIGHTDSVPYRGRGFSTRSNWHLSTDRAMAARRGLIEGGMTSSQVLQVVGMADRAPLVDNPRAATNRRIEFLVLTPQRAHAIKAMFGLPGQVVPLVEGVNAASGGDPEAAQIGVRIEAAREHEQNLMGAENRSS
jgi:chemotaxis protein MotB